MKMTSLASRLIGSLFTLAVAALPALALEEVPVTPTDTGDSVKGVLYARPFSLTEPFTYTWTAEQELVSEGHVLVVEVDPDMARARQTYMPVLYVGHRPAMVMNHGWETGLMVVVTPETDLATTSVYFGSVQLPDQVDADRGLEELAAARAMGIRPLGVSAAATALAAGGAELSLTSDLDLNRVVADVMEAYVPNEAPLIADYRLEPIGR